MPFRRIILSALCLLLAATAARAAGAGDAPLRIGLKVGSPPFTYLDKTNGETSVRGLSVDLGRLLGKAMGRPIELVRSEDLAMRRDQLKHGDIDLIILDSPSFMARSDFIFIPTGISLSRRLFVHNSCHDAVCLRDLSEKRVVMVAGDDLWQLRRQSPPREVTVVASPLEALRLLENGQSDVYIAPSEEVAQAFIHKYGFRNIRKVGVVLEQIPMYITLRQDQQELAAEVSIAMERITASGAVEKIKDKWFGVDFTPPTWKRYSRELVAAASLILAALLGIALWNRQLKVRVREVTRGLQSSERNFRAVIDSSPDMILVLDAAGGIRSCNPSAHRTLDGQVRQPGMTFLDALPAAERESGRDFLGRVFDRGQAAADFHLLDAGGGLCDIAVAAARVTDQETGEPLACCFARDMTERNRMEQELVQADRLATIGKMAASVAHEINNPLGIIRANVELLLNRGLYPEEAREFLDAIQRNTLRAGNITRDLLARARPKAPEMAEVDLYELVRATLSMVAPQLKEIEIEHREPAGRPLVWGDASLLQQVVVNVLLNARAALGGRPQPRLEIRYCRPSDSGLRILVQDNGRGIARDHLGAVFEPFFTSGTPEGFGLGLFISRRIVEHHGGVMYAESELDKGTRMIIELPMQPEQDLGQGCES